MSDLRELYQEIILEHSREPRNHRQLPTATCDIDGHNPLCGDRLHVWVQVNDGILEDISFIGTGCAISQASASLMTEGLKGKSVDDAMKAIDAFRKLVMEPGTIFDEEALPEKLQVFSNIHSYPSRVKCAILAWHTLRAALEGNQEPVTTE
jgi:nitrogen fixation NifU-like protein